ncbi:MAG: MFS transporter, partial [Stackebrandtia sp.]
WRLGLGVWAIPAALALLPWLFPGRAAATPARRDAVAARAEPTRGLTRSGLAWSMLVAFGAQAMISYIMFGWLPEILRTGGHGPAEAGFMLAVFTAVGIPLSLAVPTIAAKLRDQRGLLAATASGYAVGFPLLWRGDSPAATWAGVLLVAVGMGAFPLLLTLFGLRTKTPEGAASLAGFSQSGGYLVAGLGPLLVGVMYEAAGSWTPTFALLAAATAAHLVAGWRAAKPRLLEEELAVRR